MPDWEIGRINLKLRNPALNALYAWEELVLLKSEERIAGGKTCRPWAKP